MGVIPVEQIGPSGQLVTAPDTTLSHAQKDEFLIAALPGATATTIDGVRAVRHGDQVILRAQVTHLGRPWPEFKKRIQIPRSWVAAHQHAARAGLTTRFVGIYHHDSVTVFVDFDPTTYLQRKANNSAAHVATNDLFQAQTLGQFRRVDRNGNTLTSIRGDQLAGYLRSGLTQRHPRIDVFHRFNAEFMTGHELKGLAAVQEMHEAKWPDTFQGEWPGFYLEYRLDAFLRERGQTGVRFQKVKGKGAFDYDLAFTNGRDVEFYGDLKASSISKHESPGNDAEQIRRCVEQFGRFWYVIYEHETTHARDRGGVATVAWNEWKRSVGFTRPHGYDPLSYARRFKEAVRFVTMSILEVNQANFHMVLGDFRQGRQPDGAARALKVMIKKSNVDNFLVYSDSVCT